MGILKDHISLISFLKPGLIKIFSKGAEDRFFVEDGIVEFKDNSLSILTSSIFNIKDSDKNYINNTISYLWVSDINGRQYAVPNYSTARQINGKLILSF